MDDTPLEPIALPHADQLRDASTWLVAAAITAYIDTVTSTYVTRGGLVRDKRPIDRERDQIRFDTYAAALSAAVTDPNGYGPSRENTIPFIDEVARRIGAVTDDVPRQPTGRPVDMGALDRLLHGPTR